jgi:O-antigen ligase
MIKIKDNDNLLNIFAFIVPATIIISSATITLGIVLMFFISIYLWKTETLSFKMLDKDLKILVCLFLSVFILTIPHVIMDGGKVNALDPVSRYLMAAIIIVGFQHHAVKFETFLKGTICGAFIGFAIYILYAKFHLDAPRLRIDVYGLIGMFTLHLSYISLALFSITIIAFIYFAVEKKYPLAILSLLAVNSTSYILLESGSRGALAGVFILSMILIVYLITKKHFYLLLPTLSPMLITICLMFGNSLFNYVDSTQLTNKAIIITKGSTVQPAIMNRLSAEKHILDYEPGTATSSMTKRFEMWRSASYQFLESPIFGLGYEQRKEFNNQLIDDGVIDKAVRMEKGKDSGHSEFFHIIGTKGLIGLAFILALYFIPFRFFSKQLKFSDARHYIGLAGIFLILSFMISGLTETLFMKHKTAILYCLFTFLLYKSALTIKNKKKIDGGNVTSD